MLQQVCEVVSAVIEGEPERRVADERERAADRRDRDADKREAALDAREDQVDVREDQVDVREAADALRTEAVQKLLDDADLRDAQADDRDSAAQSRDMAATLEEYLNEATNTQGVKARHASALDRRGARADRVASKEDRSHLADPYLEEIEISRNLMLLLRGKVQAPTQAQVDSALGL